jgi:hypothetical protein
MGITMKKLLTISILFCLAFLVYGQDEGVSGESGGIRLPSWMTEEGADLSTGRRESRGLFELGLFDATFSGVLDGVDLLGGLGFDPSKLDTLNLELDILAKPMYVRVPIRDVFVLDIFTGADIDVNVNLSDRVISALTQIESLTNADNPEAVKAYVTALSGISGGMSAGASAFTEFGVGASKTLLNERLWVRAAPSLYFTLLYMKQSSILMKGYSNNNTEFGLQASGAIDLYSAWDLKDGEVNPFASPGLDLTLEACYALWPVMDVGLLISHIPIIPSTLTHRMTVDVDELSMFFDINDPKSVLTFKAPDLDKMITSGDSDNRIVMRPSRFDIYGLIKPFRSPTLIVRPNIGATVNTAFADATFNWGLTVQYNAERIISAFIGTGLTENIWAQRLGAAFDFRVFELNLSIALAGASFAESWMAKGLLVGVGLKFGF